MFLSQILLNPRSRLVQHDIGDRQHLHRTVMSGFPDTLPPAERVLYRLETARTGRLTLLVQSHAAPDWARSERLATPGVLAASDDPNPWVKPYAPVFHAGERCLFRLDANPTVKRDGKRHALLREDDQSAWLARKGSDHGFRPLALQIGKEADAFGHKEAAPMKWHSVRFDGVLEVTDADRFAAAIATGIGSAKGYGFGLLSVAPWS